MPPLIELLGQYTFPLGPPNTTALMALITGPAQMAGLTFEEGLPGTILRDTGTEPGALAVEAKRKGRVFDIAPFEIGKYLVTWVQYRAFLEAQGRYARRRWWKGLVGHDKGIGEQWRPLDNHPAENVSWYEAVAYGRWLSEKCGGEIRLPTEWEWEFAATGGQPECWYPWGPEWRENHANTYETGIGRTTAVGLFPHGAAPCGALDLSGNVWE